MHIHIGFIKNNQFTIFDEFKRNAEDSWTELHIDPIEYSPVDSDYISLLVKDNGFTAEIGKMGNGLQMWLQIMWFLARSKDCKLIILDEPDVYMHSDMVQFEAILPLNLTLVFLLAV